MQIFAIRHNLKFSQFDSLRLDQAPIYQKIKTNLCQTIVSSPQDLEFNPNFAINRDVPVVKNSVTRPVTPAVLTTDTLYSTLITCQIPAYNLYYIFQYTYLIYKSHFVYIQYLVQNCPKISFFERRRQNVDDLAQRKQTLNKYSGMFY